MLRKAVLAVSFVLGFHSICPSFAADATQDRRVWRIGYIANSPPTTPEIQRIWDAFRRALQERGYVEESNIVFEKRYLEGKPERAPDFANELVRLKVDLIVAAANPATVAAKAATSSIPIVMVSVADPVGAGLVESLARPGANVTGIANFPQDLIPKRLELLRDVLPRASRVAFIRCLKCAALDPPATEAARLSGWVSAAEALGLTLAFIDLSAPQGLDDATAAVLRARPDAVFLALNPVNFFLRKQLADFAMRERLPVFAFAPEQATAGSLMTYGINYRDMWREAAVYVDKILKGSKPADLPVEQPTKFELVINLNTAKTLGLTIPKELLLRANEVIQ